MDMANALDAQTPDISDDQLQALFASMESDGYCCIPDFVNAGSLSKMQEFVASSIHGSQNEYVAFRGSEAVNGSGLDELAQSSRFQSIFARLYVASQHRPAPPVEFYQLLRCLTGKGMMEHSLNFHYDSYLITALIPIVIPTTGRPGIYTWYRIHDPFAAPMPVTFSTRYSWTGSGRSLCDTVPKAIPRHSRGSGWFPATFICSGVTGASMRTNHAILTRCARQRSITISILMLKAG